MWRRGIWALAGDSEPACRANAPVRTFARQPEAAEGRLPASGHLPTWGGPVYSNDDHCTVYTEAALTLPLTVDELSIAANVS